MKVKKSSLTFSAVGLIASLLVVLYLVLNMPDLIELIIVFGLIVLAIRLINVIIKIYKYSNILCLRSLASSSC